MRLRPLSIGLLSVALLAGPVSPASAHGFHHHGFGLVGGIFGLAGDVVVGAVTIVTAPIVILADAVSGPHYDRRDRDQNYGGYDRRESYDGPDDRYGPPRDYDRGRPGYESGREEYDERGRFSSSAPPDEYARAQHDDRYRPEYDSGRRDDERGDGDADRDDPRQEDGPPRYRDQPYDDRDGE